MCCGLGRSCGLDPALLWLWCRLAAATPIRLLAWELTCAAGVAVKRKKKTVKQFYFLSFFFFKGPRTQHMEVLRLGVESELPLLAYTRARATQDPSHVCNLHHSSRQRQILNPLSKARDRTHNLMVPSRIRVHGAMKINFKKFPKLQKVVSCIT